MTDPQWWREMLNVDASLADRVDDEYPLTSKLGSFGLEFSDLCGNLAEQQRGRILEIVERVLASGDEEERAAVATGFLEALLHRWDDGFDLESIWPLIGPLSRKYCLAWNAFGGVESPAWMRPA
ncbi:hypothetical protein AB0M39_25570 [Streptomyces sp. NPDC051907]|uniref:DUF7674 family protein n=1 Tax=Streptomyces sp. NPDC051907 TaxID=3155284 RepID=UPI00343D1B8C